MPMFEIDPSLYASAQARLPGRELLPEGVGLEVEITDNKTGTSKKGEAYVMLCLTHEANDAEGHRYDKWEYFGMTPKRIGVVKAFLQKIGRHDIDAEIAETGKFETDDLTGTRFSVDVIHKKRRDSDEIDDTIDYKSISPINWIDGQPARAAKKAAPAPAAAPEQPARRRAPAAEPAPAPAPAPRRRAAAPTPAPQQELTYEDDNDDPLAVNDDDEAAMEEALPLRTAKGPAAPGATRRRFSAGKND